MKLIDVCLSEVKSKLDLAAERSGRTGEDVVLVAVSKTRPAADVREAVEAGQLHFGENRIQEAEGKIPEVTQGAPEWHLIGGLQKNKVRKALGLFSCIQTVDSLGLAERIDRIAGEMALRPAIFLQINLAAEPQKGGFLTSDLEIALPAIRELKNLDVRGLMAIPPFTSDEGEARRHFSEMREYRDRLESAHGVALPGLSMGMSGDFEIAIEEGATLVRVGSSIFGARG